MTATTMLPMDPREVGPLLGLIGESPGIVAVRDTVRRLLPRLAETTRPPALLIQGETGTGKGVLARAIHRASPRRDGPFVDVNCAAIPETLLEAELFGYERGAFTDARQAKAGLFQTAHRGSLFLDELGLLPPPLQGKLLTVIEDRAVRRLGSTRTEPVDVWILAATSSDLEGAMRAGQFHDALYHRLTVLKLWLPPLRERGDDVVVLAEHLLTRACRDHGLSVKRLHESARAALGAHSWPGNLRELANVMERVALLEEGTLVTGTMLDLGETHPLRATPPRETAGRLRARVAGVEREEIAEALRQSRGNVTHAAMKLGIPANTLRYRIQKHALSPRTMKSGRGRSRSRPPETAPTAPGLTTAGVIRWESRLVAVLRATLGTSAGVPALPETTRPTQMLVDKVASFGGRVEELAPSGMVAAFGIEPLDDAPRRAALAARAIRAALSRAREESAVPWRASLGLHVAPFLVGQLDGGALTLDLDAKRRAWTVLDALGAAAEPEGVVLSADAARLLDRRFELAPAGSLEGVGPIFRLGGAERAGPGLPGQLTRFVGRDEELRLLRQRAEATRAGRGQAVAITGESGIGKSRLLFELFRYAEGEGWRHLEGRCVPHGRPVPYVPFADVVRQLFRIADSDSTEVLVDKVHQGLALLGLEPRGRAPFVLAVLGMEPEGIAGSLDADVTRARIVETMRQLLLAVSWQRPLVLAIEDVHWVDADSRDLLGALAASLAGAPLLLVATCRAGHRSPWPARSDALSLTLKPLSREESLVVLQTALGAHPISESQAELILARSEGNPFFLEELARAAVEDPTSTAAAPVSIREMVLSRIRRLSAEDRSILQCAAVIGKDVPLVILEAVAGLTAETLAPRLARLAAAQFLREGPASSEPGYVFKHVLTQEAAYSTLEADERRSLHRRALEAIEAAYPGRLVEHRDQLGHHVVRGEVWGKALDYLRAVGMNEVRLVDDQPTTLVGGSPYWVDGRHHQAVERAHADLRVSTEFRNFEAQLVLHLQLGQAYHSLGANRQAIEVLGRNAVMLEGDVGLRRFQELPGLPAVLSRAWLAAAHAELGEFPEGEACAREGVAIADAAGDRYDRAVADWAVGVVALFADTGAALEALTRARNGAREGRAQELLQLIGPPLGLALARSSRLDEATAVFEEWAAVPEERRVRADRARGMAWHAEVDRLAGRRESAELRATRAVARAREQGERGHEAHALAALASVTAGRGAGAVADAEAAFSRALAIADELEMRPLAARCRAGLAQLPR